MTLQLLSNDYGFKPKQKKNRVDKNSKQIKFKNKLYELMNELKTFEYIMNKNNSMLFISNYTKYFQKVHF